jgi:sugar lactone lactonase YvrE
VGEFVKDHFLSFSSGASLLGVAFALGLTGCSANFGDVASTSSQTAMHIKGVVHGGQQSLNGAHIYMYAASTAGYGGSGIAASSSNASTSLLTAATGNPADGNGNFYVITDEAGNFDINGAYACTPNTQVYLYSVGGDPQVNGVGTSSGANLAATLMAVVGNCASATPSAAFPGVTFVAMNEVSTAVTAFALAGFATDPLHIGAPSAVAGHALSGTGLANAFNTALNIVNQASGLPNSTLPLNSNAAVPVTTINTLADILAACVNSSGAGSSGCGTLFSNTTYGTAPTDTTTAAIHIAQNPGGNVTALIGLATNTSPFQPFISSANDFSLGINYAGGGLSFPDGIAIDGTGNAWVADVSSNAVTEISSAGAFLSGTNGYTGGGLADPLAIAIDNSGNAWVANDGGAVTEISSTGALLSGTNGYTAGGVNQPQGIALDGLGDAWVTNAGRGSVTKLSNAGAPLSGANGYTGGGLSVPLAIAIDGSGNAWVADELGDAVIKLSSTGTILSGANGYTGVNEPDGIAVDGSGNVWVSDAAGNSVTEIIGIGTPVITPIAAGLPVVPTTDGTSNLGTRP